MNEAELTNSIADVIKQGFYESGDVILSGVKKYLDDCIERGNLEDYVLESHEHDNILSVKIALSFIDGSCKIHKFLASP